MKDPLRLRMFLGTLLTLVIIFAALVFTSSSFLRHFGFEKPTALTFFVSRLSMWLCLVPVWLYARKVEKQKMLLWEEKKYNWWVYLVSVFAVYGTLIVALIFVALILVGFGFSRDSSKMQEVTEILRANKGLMVFTALTAGVMEELTFRGYILSRFELLFRNSGLAIFLSSVLFGLMHFGYGNMFQLAGPFVIGFIFALYYWKFRNIKVVIICHFLWDMMSLAVSTMKH